MPFDPGRQRPRAVLFPQHLPGEAWIFTHPLESFSGHLDAPDLLESVLARAECSSRVDNPRPEELLVGGITYEGETYFERYQSYEVIDREALWPTVEASGETEPVFWDVRPGRNQYLEMVEAARSRIAEGKIYQVNLARIFECCLPDFDPWEFFRFLVWATQAPLSCLIPLEQCWAISGSPELFLRLDGRRIRTCPIKGTRPRDRNPLKDRQNAFDLCTSEKEVAELVMITDLERNDLGQVCEPGGVEVPELLKHESFSHVHHLVSTVEGCLRPEISMLEAIRRCFPGGSITGAPKKSAREAITELEGEPRGIYTGALGYLGFDGTAQLNIAIRTVESRGDRIRFQTGSGITWGSDPVAEFDETGHKSRGVLDALEWYVKCRQKPLFRQEHSRSHGVTT